MSYYPTWPVDGPPPIAPLFGLIPAAAAPAAGVRIVVDTVAGPVDENTIAPEDAGLEPGLFRRGNAIWMRAPDGKESRVWVPANSGRERWGAGVEVYPYPPNLPEGWDECGGSARGEKGFGENLTPPEFRPLTLTEAITCTTQQVPDEAAFRARAVAVLAATESWRVAREFMSGETLGDTSPHLTDTAATFPNGQSATKPNHGLQVLEQAIAETGRLGVVHCSPMLTTALLGLGFAISDKSGVIRTVNGNVVIPDAGYVGVSKPDSGVAPTASQEWAYATGPIDIRRSEIFTTPDTRAQALDRGLGATNDRPNQITYRAERYELTVWDTALQAAVLIDRCETDCVISS